MEGELKPLQSTNEYNPNYKIEDVNNFTFDQLSQLKKSVEDELTRLHSSLTKNKVTMETPLVTFDGFPRSDINVIEVRTLRILIIKLTNDLAVIRNRIMQLLPSQFKAKEATQSHVPFAIISEIQPESPSSTAGLVENDKLISIANVNVINHDNLKGLVKLVSSSRNVPLGMKVLRNGQILELKLIPAEWSGRGLLGCKLTQV
ncbi:hypothetical protein WICPIJ_001591 [Wickerhamomyces pijperi]|uniref:Probable 26S proteasome regulatory subunit p27 n=1 Tax=Wickerhamomyces pijperi TaxID=599730 RepID=A0A9P8QDF6_WICPI|nr:hypothetical protein WICPIJ_001591 [Wickerhamomyces pijperi]